MFALTFLSALLRGAGPRLIVGGVVALAVAALLALAALQARGALTDAETRGYAQAEAVWRASLAKANAETERRIAEAWRQAAETGAALVAENDALARQLKEINDEAARLPGGTACGLDADRVRRLPP
jgi:uncharacterized membrane protein YqiK